MSAVAVLASLLLTQSPPPLVEAEVAAPRSERAFQRVGVSLDLGVPEGAALSLQLRPWRWVRLSGGPAHNGASTGAQASLTLVPFQWVLRPTLSASAGHFPEGDARGLARTIAGQAFAGDVLFSRVQYDWAGVHLGLELGSTRGTSFVLKGGMSRVRARLPAFEEAAQATLGASDLTVTAPRIDVLAPSVQVGLLVYLGG